MANLQKLIDLDGLSCFLGQIKAKFVRSVNNIKPDSSGNINIADMTGATYNSSGKAGLAPIPAAGKQDMALCGDATYKVLPVSGGGTGQTTVAGVRYVLGLGNTNGALPIANGGTGATTATQALLNLGGVKSVNGVSADSGGNINVTSTFFAPDYSSAVELASSTEQTIASDGYIYVWTQNYGNGSQNLTLTINDIEFTIITNNYSCDSLFFPVLKGDIVRFKADSLRYSVKFYKLR